MRNIVYTVCSVLFCVQTHAQTGSLDPAFGTNGIVITPAGSGRDEIEAIVFPGNGKILVGGHSFNGANFDFLLARYTSNGTLDNTFGNNGIVITPVSAGDDFGNGIVLQNDGKIVMVGFGDNGDYDIIIARYTVDGDLDVTFGGTGIVTISTAVGASEIGNVAAIQPDGKILIAGYREAGNATDFVLVRLEADGDPDPDFGGGDGIVTRNISQDDYGTGLVLQPGGKIVMSGYTGTNNQFAYAMARFNEDGTPDITFGTGGSIFHPAAYVSDYGYNNCYLQPDGKIVQAGSLMNGTDINTRHLDFGLLRYNTDGSLDNTFGTGGIVRTNIAGITPSSDLSRSAALQPDGKIVMAGYSGGDFIMVRLLSNGTPDNNFGINGIVTTDMGSGHNDMAYIIKMAGNRIFVGGATGVLPDLHIVLAAFQNDVIVGAPLPLTLQQFTAQKLNNTIQLQWLTEHESGIMQFDVERSSDGRRFSSIGYRLPDASSSLKKKYSFTDAQPLPGVNYYRLRIKEVDGSINISNIIAIKPVTQVSQLEIFTNPVPATLRMQLPGGLNGNINLFIADASGRIVRTMELAGTGNPLALSIDVSKLVKGMYIIRAQTGQTIITGRFLKN